MKLKKIIYLKILIFNNPKILKRFRKEVERKKIELSQLQETLFLIKNLKDGNDFSMKIINMKNYVWKNGKKCLL